MKGFEPPELIFWIIVAILIVVFFLLFANQIIFGYLKVTPEIQP